MKNLFKFLKKSISTKKENSFFKVETFQAFNFLSTMDLEQQIVANNISSVNGWCSVCNKMTAMIFSHSLHHAIKNGMFINWREDAICQECHFNARTRATVDLVDRLILTGIKSAYATEAVTPLYFALKEKIPALIGSEYLGEDKIGGHLYPYQEKRVSHEDITKLSFSDNSLGLILSFDVLEHVNDYKLALTEIYRTLKQGGHTLLSTPINPRLKSTVTRAYIDNTEGQVKHLLEPAYHHNFIGNEGILCFHDFGADLVDLLYAIGFSGVDIFIAQSATRHYYGDFIIFLYATK
ncbi:class I SAM-dependent methyltransferase [Beggiatoa leptomitoformis]|nr:class I SAM-dependent methyltransferase [Beggiatoa leptomitoformis]